MNRSTSTASAASAAAAFLRDPAERLDRDLAAVELQVRDGAAVDQGEGPEDAVDRDQHGCAGRRFARARSSRAAAGRRRRAGAGRERSARAGAWRGRRGRRRARPAPRRSRRARRARRAAAAPPSGRGRGRPPGRGRPGSGGRARRAPRRGRPASLGPSQSRDEDVGVVLADHRAAHDHPAHRGEKEEVDQRLARGRHAGRVEALAQLVPGQRPLFGQAPARSSSRRARPAAR